MNSFGKDIILFQILVNTFNRSVFSVCILFFRAVRAEVFPFSHKTVGMHHIYLTLVKLVHNYRNEGFFQTLEQILFSVFRPTPQRLSCLVVFFGGLVFGQILQQGITSSLTSLTG